MTDLNRAFLIGRLTRDPEKSYTASGVAVTKFSIAVNNGFGDNRRTAFIDITTWDKSAEFVSNYFAKGREILIEGRLEFDSWEAKDGSGRRSKLYVTAERVSFVGSRNDNNQNDGDQGAPTHGGNENSPSDLDDDDIPF